MDRHDQDYFLEDEMQMYYQPIQAITGSQIIRAYGVPPIQEAPSNEEITLRHIDSHLSNFGRGEHRHLSQGYSNMSNILTPKLQGHRTVNDINSIVILPNKKEQGGSATNLQTSLQILVQQNQNSQQLPQNNNQVKSPSNQGIDYYHQGSGFSIQNKVLMTEEDLSDLRQQDSNRQKTSLLPYQLQSQLPQQQNQLQNQQMNQQAERANQQMSSNLDNQQGAALQGSVIEITNIQKEQQKQNQLDKQDNKQQQQQSLSTQQTQQQQIQLQQQNSNSSTSQVQRTNTKSEAIFQSKSVKIMCPFCSKNIQTRVSYTPSCKTHLVSVGLGIFGFICGLCLVPYYFQDKFQTAIHFCPSCNQEIGRCEY